MYKFAIMKEKETIEHITNWIKSYIYKSNLNGLTIGVSGGIDSALTSCLCAMTNLPVLCLEMPIYQDKKQVNRGKDHIRWLKNKFQNVSSIEINLTKTFDAFRDENQKDQYFDNLALANTRSRIRMTSLYFHAQINNYLVVGTGNRIEDFGIGFFTKYGDGGVDISPIADLLKSEVYNLSDYLKINNEIITAPPTDGLWDNGKTDQEQIGASYSELEWAMKYKDSKEILSNRQNKVLEIYKAANIKNQHKMKSIPVCKIPSYLR